MKSSNKNTNKPNNLHSTSLMRGLHLPLGMYGLIIWFFVTLVFIGSISLFLWGNTQQRAYASATTKYDIMGLFAAVPNIANSIGFTHGEADHRANTLDSFLASQGSPLAGHAETFIRVADACPMDWTLLPAIAGKESAYGRLIPTGSYNAFGWAIYTGQQSGAVFQNWDHAIEVVGSGLCENYIKEGRTTPELIEQLYTPLSAQTHGGWRAHVTRLMDQIQNWE